MKTIMIGLMTATTLLAAPAMARDSAVYVGLGGGVVKAEDIDWTVGTTNNQINGDTGLGWEAEGVLGYDFGAIRLELEGAYKDFALDELDGASGGIPVNAPVSGGSNGILPGTYADVNGRVNLFSGMLNALLDFGGEDGVGFSVGGGLGLSNVRMFDITVNPAGPGFLDDNDVKFAWQGLAQLRVPVSDAVDIGVKYKYHNVDDVSLVDEAGRNLSTIVTTLSLLATV